MNKRLIISIIVIVVIVFAGAFGIKEFLSYKDVSVVLKQPDVAVTIYAMSGDKKITSLSDNTTLRLKTGQYYYTPTGEKYDTSKVYFDIEDSESVEVDPSYSREYLSKLLTIESQIVRDALTGKYPSITSGYIIGDEQLAHQGEWYTAKLIQRVSGGNQPDVYRVVMENKDDSWQVAIEPRLIIGAKEYSSIPQYVIQQANEPLSNEAYALLYPE